MRRKNFSTETLMNTMSDTMIGLLEKKSYDQISVMELSRKSGVNRSSYYRHFSSRDQVVLYGLFRIAAEYSSRYEKEDKKGLSPYLECMFNTFRGHKKELTAVYEAGLSYLFTDVFSADLAPDQAEGKKGLKEAAAVGAIANLLTAWLSHGMKESPSDAAGILVKQIPDGVLSI